MKILKFNEFINEAYDENKYPSRHAYNVELISKQLGKKNSYSGSADWGGLDVWTVKGDKFEGTFVVIDDNNDVILMTRKFDENQEENINNDITNADGDNEDAINILLKKALDIKNEN